MRIEDLRERLLHLLRLPPEPPAPYGEEKSLRVFRASPQYLKYQLVIWGIGHAVVVCIVLVAIVGGLIASISSGEPAAIAVVLIAGLIGSAIAGTELLISFLAIQLQYEMRWYKVTDRSLRIREGVFHVREMTLTFMNIQNIEVMQGPIQRWLGIADVKVQTAGGGGGMAGQSHSGGQPQMFNMHVGYFRGVDNAQEILELMQERLRRSRSAGLGDPEDAEDVVVADHEDKSAPGNVVIAARELLEEVRRLRQVSVGA